VLCPAPARVHLAARGRGAATLSTALNSNNLNVMAGLLLPAAVIGLALCVAVAAADGRYTRRNPGRLTVRNDRRAVVISFR
jgi:hypothetical protein